MSKRNNRRRDGVCEMCIRDSQLPAVHLFCPQLFLVTCQRVNTNSTITNCHRLLPAPLPIMPMFTILLSLQALNQIYVIIPFKYANNYFSQAIFQSLYDSVTFPKGLQQKLFPLELHRKQFYN